MSTSMTTYASATSSFLTPYCRLRPDLLNLLRNRDVYVAKGRNVYMANALYQVIPEKL